MIGHPKVYEITVEDEFGVKKCERSHIVGIFEEAAKSRVDTRFKGNLNDELAGLGVFAGGTLNQARNVAVAKAEREKERTQQDGKDWQQRGGESERERTHDHNGQDDRQSKHQAVPIETPNRAGIEAPRGGDFELWG